MTLKKYYYKNVSLYPPVYRGKSSFLPNNCKNSWEESGVTISCGHFLFWKLDFAGFLGSFLTPAFCTCCTSLLTVAAVTGSNTACFFWLFFL